MSFMWLHLNFFVHFICSSVVLMCVCVNGDELFSCFLQRWSVTGHWRASGPSSWWCSGSCCLTSLLILLTALSRPICLMCAHIQTRREACTTMLCSQVSHICAHAVSCLSVSLTTSFGDFNLIYSASKEVFCNICLFCEMLGYFSLLNYSCNSSGYLGCVSVHGSDSGLRRTCFWFLLWMGRVAVTNDNFV